MSVFPSDIHCRHILRPIFLAEITQNQNISARMDISISEVCKVPAQGNLGHFHHKKLLKG